jgi:hypothetical protein
VPVDIFPDSDHPMPETFKDEMSSTFHEEANLAANTAILLSGLGMPYEMTDEDAMQAKELFENVEKHKKPTKASTEVQKQLTTPGVALALGAYIGEYGRAVVSNAVETRTLIHNRLLEISQCGDPKHELKALELLGKMSDVGAFTEKSELVITHKTSDELQDAIREKINRLLHSDIIDVEPLSDGLEEELRLEMPDYEDVGESEEVPTEPSENDDTQSK